jgi:hypothetical protein
MVHNYNMNTFTYENFKQLPIIPGIGAPDPGRLKSGFDTNIGS